MREKENKYIFIGHFMFGLCVVGMYKDVFPDADCMEGYGIDRSVFNAEYPDTRGQGGNTEAVSR